MKKYIYLFPVLSALLLTFSGPGYDYTVLSFIALVPVMYSIKRHTEKMDNFSYNICSCI